MMKAFLCSAFLASIVPAVADEPQSPNVQGPEIGCRPLGDLKAHLDHAGGKLVELTSEQFHFARGVYIATPPVSATLPPGDRGALAFVDDRSELLFIDGDAACDAGALPPPLRQMLLDVGAGKVNHLGHGT